MTRPDFEEVRERLAKAAFRRAGVFLKDHWPPFVAALTVSSILSGLAYFQAYLGGLGFAGVLTDLSPTTYVMYGGLTAMLAISAQGVLVAVAFPFIEHAALRGGDRSFVDWIYRRCRRAAPTAGIVVIIVIAALPWQWIAPDLARVISIAYPWGIVIAAIILVGLFFIAFMGLRGRWYTVFAVVTLLVSIPALGYGVGVAEAERLVKDPDSFPRVLVWENATSNATGYVLAHQQGERLYLVQITTHYDNATNSTQTYPISTTLELDRAYRVEFFPAGAKIERYRLE